MRILADVSKGRLTLGDAVFQISNRIRTIRDGTRGSSEVIRSIPDNLPYDPQPFPRGTWRITGLEWQKEKGFDPRTYGPVKIKTDAWQPVKVWELDREGDYLRETKREVRDSAYWLHYSAYATTLGCIRLSSPLDAEAIAKVIQAALGCGESVFIEVG